MTPRVLTEQPLSLAMMARELPPLRGPRPVSRSTLLRWHLTGCRAADGRIVHLECARLGSQYVTSRAAVARFSAALAAREEVAGVA